MFKVLKILSYSLLVSLLSSCILTADKVEMIGFDRTKVGGTVDENIEIKVDSVSLAQDELIVSGSQLDSITKVSIRDGHGLNQELSISNKSKNALILSSSQIIKLALNSAIDLIFENAYGQSVTTVQFDLVDGSITSVKIADGAITADKLSSMGAGVGQVLRFDGTTWQASDLNSLTYAGNWDANTNTPDLTIGGSLGEFYIVETAGNSDLSGGAGTNSWLIGDWVVWNNVIGQWEKVEKDTAATVTSFNGRNGAITAQAGDYTWAQIDKTTSSISDLSDIDLSTPATTGQVLKFDGTQWYADDDRTSGGSNSVSSSEITDGTIVNADIDASAGIVYSKLNIADGDIPEAKVSGLASLRSTVSSHTTDISTHSSDITSLNTSISNHASQISNNASNISSNSSNITTNTSNISANTTAISSLTKADIGLANVDDIQQMPLSYLDTDSTLAANSNTQVPSQQAIKTYVDNSIAGFGAGDFFADGSVPMTGSLNLNNQSIINGMQITTTNLVLRDQGADSQTWQLRELIGNEFALQYNSVQQALFTQTGALHITQLCDETGANCKDASEAWSTSSGTVTSITGGAGLSDGPITTTGTLDINIDNTTIEIATDALQLKDGGITNAKINATAAIDYSKLNIPDAAITQAKVNGLTTLASNVSTNTSNISANTTAISSLTKADIGLSNVDDIQQLPLSYLDTDNTLTANSNTRVPSQMAIKTYVDSAISGVSSGSGDFLADGSVAMTGAFNLGNQNLINGGSLRVSEICDETGVNCKDISDPWTGGGGTVTSVSGGAGLSDGPITTSGSLSVNVDDVTLEIPVDTLQLKDGGITNSKISATAAIDYSKLNIADGDIAQAKVNGLTALASSVSTNASNISGNTTAISSLTKADIGLSNVDDIQQMPLSYLDTDVALSADSNTRVPSQMAIKSYVDTAISSVGNGDFLADGTIPMTGALNLNSQNITNGGDLNITRICDETGSNCRDASDPWSSGSGTVTSVGGGDGLSDGPITTSGSLSVNVDTTTIEIAADTLQIANGAITNALVSATAAIDYTKLDIADGEIPQVKVNGLTTLSSTVSGNTSDIASNSFDISTNTSNIATNATNITSNTNAISTLGPSDVGLTNVDDIQQMPLSYLDIDATLSSDSDLLVPSQKAIKSYVDTAIAGVGSGSGDFLADGTVPMTGALNLNDQNIAAGNVGNFNSLVLRDQGADTNLWALTESGSNEFLIQYNSLNQALFTNAGALHITQICDETGANCKDASDPWGSGSGTVTSVAGGDGLSDGPITTTGSLSVNVDDSTIAIVTDVLEVKDGGITDAKVSATAAIAQSKINNLTTDLSSKLPLAGGTMTGDIAFSATQTFDGVDISALDSSVAAKAEQSTSIIAGAGLSGGGDLSLDRTLDISVDDATIEIATDTLQIKDGGVTDAKIASLSDTKITTACTNGQIIASDGTQYVCADATSAGNWTLNTTDLYYNGGNVAIGKTTPTTTLDVDGNTRSTAFFAEEGSAASPSYAFATSPSTGLYNPTATTSLGIAVNGAEVLRAVDGAKVGIGKAGEVVEGTLHVKGSSTLVLEDEALSSPTFFFKRHNGGSGVLDTELIGQFFTYTEASDGSFAPSEFMSVEASENHIPTGIGSRIRFSTVENGATAATDRLTIDHDGDIKIGTGEPQATLDIGGAILMSNEDDISTISDILFMGDGAIAAANHLNLNIDGLNDGTGDFSIKVGSETSAAPTLFTVKNDGNVGVGTSTPTSKLHIAGDLRLNSDIHPSIFYTESDNSDLEWQTVADGRAFSIRVNNTTPYPLSILENKDVILNGGNVGIGTTSPAQKLSIVGGNISLADDYAIGRSLGSASDEHAIYMFKTGIQAMTGGATAPHDNALSIESDAEITFVETDNDALKGYMDLNTGLFNWFGDLTVGGAIAKGSGTFDIPHPNEEKAKEGVRLRHSFVESPNRGDNIYRYKVEVVDGEAVIELPDYFKDLNEDEQIWVNAVEHFGRAFGKVNKEQTQLTVKADTDGPYNVLLIATRKDEIAKKGWDAKAEGPEYTPRRPASVE